MKKYFLFFGLLATGHSLHAQISALTETGKEVILFEDGTWKYSNDSIASPGQNELKINPEKFTRPAESTFLVKSKDVNVGVYINPAKWTFIPQKENQISTEYRFGMKTGDGYAVMITEKTQIPLENMRQIALINAQKAAVDAKETSAEYRTVNGIQVLCLKISGTIQGIKFVYMGYYYSNENGTVQLLSYTSQNLFAGIQKDLEKILNGLVEIKKQ